MKKLVAIAFLGLVLSGRGALAADVLIAGVPIPDDVRIQEANLASNSYMHFLGAWVGAWGGSLPHILVVESVRPDGVATVVYAVGDGSTFARQWKRHDAKIVNGSLTIETTFSATYAFEAPDKLNARWQRGESRTQAKLSKIELAALLAPGADVPWRNWGERSVSMLETDLMEDGKSVRLELVVFRPSGGGLFPLVVFNHGSTGTGRDPSVFRATYAPAGMAGFFVQRGWMVAFPQRRGRGKSEGRYEEGFHPDRSQGYACEPKYSLPGADRALQDIRAAIASLSVRADVDPRRILIAGQSRGGILSVAYAGKHPDQVIGVINFVGGWMSERCQDSRGLNGSLFARGAKFPRESLWLYAHNDPYYSVAFSKGNYQSFKAAGGKGAFFEFSVPEGSGHNLGNWPTVWGAAVDQYLANLPNQRR